MSLTSRHRTRHRSIRTGPVVSIRTGRHSPPGFHVGSIASQFWNAPVMVRFAFLLCCGGHATSTASTCSVASRERLGDVEAVRKEVALRISEIGTVEPHVGLIEDAIEGDEVPLSLRRRGEVESLAIDQRVVVVGERNRGCASGWEPRPRARHRRRIRDLPRCVVARRRQHWHATVPTVPRGRG